jgi:hypothetical protein
MKKLFISEEPQDAAFLEWGRKKLAQLKKLGNKVSKTYFVDPDVMVRVRSQPDEVLVRRVSVGGFFGCGLGQTVQPRNHYRGITAGIVGAYPWYEVDYDTIEYPGNSAIHQKQVTLYDCNSVVVGVIAGTFEQTPSQQIYSNWFSTRLAPEPYWVVLDGTLGPGNASSLVVAPTSPSYESLVVSDAAPNSKVIATDGQVLATGNFDEGTNVNDSGYYYTNNPLATPWPGGNWFPTFNALANEADGLFTPGERITFTVPDDVGPPAGDWSLDSWYLPPTYPQTASLQTYTGGGDATTLNSLRFLAPGTTVTSSFTVSGPGGTYVVSGTATTLAEPQYTVELHDFFLHSSYSVVNGQFPSSSYEQLSYTNHPAYIQAAAIPAWWHADWRAAREEARDRERTRLKEHSDDTIQKFRDGELPVEFEYFIRRFHPASELTKRKFPMSIVSGPTYSLLESTDAADGFEDYEKWEGRCTLRYNFVDEQNQSFTREQEFVGYATFRGPLRNVYSRFGGTHVTTDHSGSTVEYENFPLLDQNYGSANAPPTYTASKIGVGYWHDIAMVDVSGLYMHDGLSWPLFGVLNGTWTNATAWCPTSRFINGPAYSTAVVPYCKDDPYPVSSVGTVAFTHPDWFKQYLEDSPMVEVGEDDASGLFSANSLVDGTKISIIPLSLMVGETERGVFTHVNDFNTVDGAKLYGYAVFKYAAETNSFSFVRWVEQSPAVTIEYEPVASYRTNCVGVTTAAKWSDVKQAMRAQKDELASAQLSSPEIDLYRAVKTALGL